MEELIYLLIKLIVKGFESSGSGGRRKQEQELRSRLAWEQRLAWERRQRELLERRPVPLISPVLEDAAGPAVKKPVMGAAAPAGLGRPRTLRDRFILTEILKPPVALRPPA